MEEGDASVAVYEQVAEAELGGAVVVEDDVDGAENGVMAGDVDKIPIPPANRMSVSKRLRGHRDFPLPDRRCTFAHTDQRAGARTDCHLAVLNLGVG